MQVIRISDDSFSLWRDQIEELLNQSVRINFPNAKVEESYGKDKCTELAAYLENNSAIVFAAIEGKKLAGFVWCHAVHRLDGTRLHVAEIAVANEWQRTGIGSKLLDNVEQCAAKSGYQAVDLFVTTSNSSAVSFYESASFEVERFLMKKTVQAGENIDA